MQTVAALIGFLCLGITPCADDRLLEDRTGNKAVDLLISDITERHRDQAIARISDVTSVAGRTELVRTPTEFVNRLLGCSLISNSIKSVGVDNYFMGWSCNGKRYFTYLDASHAKPYIVVQFEDEHTIKESAFAPAPARTGSDNHVPPSPEFINAIADSLLAGRYDPVRALMRKQAIVSVGRRDRSKDVIIVERDELGSNSLSSITLEAFEHVGRPSSFKCDQDRYGGTCKFLFDQPGVALTCIIGAYNGAINVIRFVWETPEQNRLDAARNWEEG